MKIQNPVKVTRYPLPVTRKRLLVTGCGLLVAMLIFTFPCRADSVWNEDSSSPYSTQKAYKVGDIINVIILESSTAKNLAGTKTDVKDDLGAKFTHTIARLAPIIGTNNQAAGQLSNKYAGSGQTTRGSNVQARFAAWVTEVLPGGNLAIKGEHKVEVNDEMQEIFLTGVIRPKDISSANTIYSYQVAKADLSVRGTGSVADSESPGWISRILNWLF